MIKEILERIKRKKILRVFRKDMLELGISTEHLADDKLLKVLHDTWRWDGESIPFEEGAEVIHCLNLMKK